MRAERVIGVTAAVVMALAATSCDSGSPRVAAPAPTAVAPGTPSPAPGPPAPGAPAPQPTGELRYAVGLRTLALHRGNRPLRTLVFYPVGAAKATASAELTTAGPARGRFPLVLFSHGLHGVPERYTDLLASWAAAGFVVAAPAYPYTNQAAPRFSRGDIANQPADAAYVLWSLRRLDHVAGDPLHQHIDTAQVAAVGHSAGAFTTTGLFAAGHPAWLRSGVILAGWLAPGAFAGPPATMLFMQGAQDTVVPISLARTAYNAVPWKKKSYILMPNSWHADYMLPTGNAFDLVDQTVTDFLRWTLNHDQAAHRRLPLSTLPTPEAN